MRRRAAWAIALSCGFAGVFGLLSGPSGAQTTTSQAGPTTTPSSVAPALAQWARAYEHDIGTLADDTLVVVDDGKNTAHPTKKQVTTTLKDCRQWRSDAVQARTAAPPIPDTGGERAWTSMIAASARAALDCTTALLRGDLTSAHDFGKQLTVIRGDEAALATLFGAPGP